jgi:hypothetical protein
MKRKTKLLSSALSGAMMLGLLTVVVVPKKWI